MRQDWMTPIVIVHAGRHKLWPAHHRQLRIALATVRGNPRQRKRLWRMYGAHLEWALDYLRRLATELHQ